MKTRLKKWIGAAIIPLSFIAFSHCYAINKSFEIQPNKTVCLEKESISLDQRIDNLLKPYSDSVSVGIEVVSLKDGKTLYNLNKDEKLIPASCVKIVTSLAALKSLGPDYRFETELYTDGKVKCGVLEGNLYIKGYGDPGLESEDLWNITRELYRKGIKEVKGDIIADSSFFDNKNSPGYYENLDERNYSQAYNAPSDALSLNFNTVNVYINPGEKKGDDATITLDPITNYIEIINKVKTGKRTKLKVERLKNVNKDTIVAEGTIKPNSLEQLFPINISEPSKYLVTVFKELLEKRSINVHGSLKEGLVPEDSYKILTHNSKPLSLIIRHLCKFSNNFVADQIVKTLAAKIKDEPGTNENGVKILEVFLDGIGVKDYELVDGSGYSVKNKFTASEIIKVLKYAYEDFRVSPEFVFALPIAGVDGTLKQRLHYIEGYARAKTGLMRDTGVCNISGYIKSDSDVLAFSILMNSKNVYVWDMKDVQDKILRELIKESSSK